MQKFKNVRATDYEHQKGVDIEIQGPVGELIIINVYVDVIEECTLKAEWDDEVLLHTTIAPASFLPAIVSYSDDKSYLYIKFDCYELHIKLEAEGVVFDVWDMKSEVGDCIDTSNLMYAELAA